MQGDIEAVFEIIERHGYQKASLIGILLDIQAKNNYLPRKALAQVSRSLDIPLQMSTNLAGSIKLSASNPREDTPFRFAWNGVPRSGRRQGSRLS